MKMFELLPSPFGSIFRKLTHFTCNSRSHGGNATLAKMKCCLAGRVYGTIYNRKEDWVENAQGNCMRYVLTVVLSVCSVALLADAPIRIERRKSLTANVGVVSVGLDTYWKQCPGLYDDMLKKAAVFEKHITAS